VLIADFSPGVKRPQSAVQRRSMILREADHTPVAELAKKHGVSVGEIPGSRRTSRYGAAERRSTILTYR
jgi:hypothetical protein